MIGVVNTNRQTSVRAMSSLDTFAKAACGKRFTGNNHPTVKPVALMRYLCRLVTPPNGLILDPFMGSGSTGVACVYEGFRFLGIELQREHFETSKRRILEAKANK